MANTLNMKIYHYPKCKKSREGLKYLENKGIKAEVIDYIKNPIGLNELKDILLKLNKKPKDIIRVNEQEYKKELKGKNFNDNEWMTIILENPKLIQRPIVVGRHKAVIAIPPENIDILLK